MEQVVFSTFIIVLFPLLFDKRTKSVAWQRAGQALESKYLNDMKCIKILFLGDVQYIEKEPRSDRRKNNRTVIERPDGFSPNLDQMSKLSWMQLIPSLL